MNSRIFTGSLYHGRLLPVRHAFTYPCFMLAFDIAELPAIEQAIPLFGYNRVRPVALWDRDYLHAVPGSIREKLQRVLDGRGCGDDIAQVVLLTVPRCAHYVFNPLSFFYCHRADGSLRAVVAEVNNTYGERHLYVMDAAHARPGPDASFVIAKEFFVSPFNDMKGQYHFDLAPLADRLDIRIRLVRDEGEVLRVTLRGTASPLSTRGLLYTLLRYPLSAALIAPRITGQALALRYQKGLRPRLKPNPTSDQTIIMAPKPKRRTIHRLVG